MKVLILYFSGTGNTKFMARQVKAAPWEFDCDTELHSSLLLGKTAFSVPGA